jgi:hypothetical protein
MKSKLLDGMLFRILKASDAHACMQKKNEMPQVTGLKPE